MLDGGRWHNGKTVLKLSVHGGGNEFIFSDRLENNVLNKVLLRHSRSHVKQSKRRGEKKHS